MALCRLVGWLFLGAALLLLGAELVRSLEAGGWASLALGEAWYALDPASLNAAQAAVQRHLHPALWDPGAIAALRSPAWLAALLPGLLLLWACRRRRGRRRR
jgi:hypothetical protein